MTTTSIEWCRNADGSKGKTWNWVDGCKKVSAGCDQCYAAGIAHRFAGTVSFPNGFAVTMHPERLTLPLRWRKPTVCFVNSMSDAFEASIPTEAIAASWAVMALSGRHTFKLLTKRPARMHSVLTNPGFYDEVSLQLETLTESGIPAAARRNIHTVRAWLRRRSAQGIPEPLPNLHLGVSVELQSWADLRIPVLEKTPAAIRWISVEPCLGAVSIVVPQHRTASCVPSYQGEASKKAFYSLDWVVCGGESGPSARPLHPQWARDLRDQCQQAGIPFFFKQWGRWKPLAVNTVAHQRKKVRVVLPDGSEPVELSDYDGELSDHGAVPMISVGKSISGRLLDGHIWDESPAAQNPLPEVA